MPTYTRDLTERLFCHCGQVIVVTREQYDAHIDVACPRCHTFFCKAYGRGDDADTDH